MPLRSGQVMAEKACHDLSSTTRHGLTQALGRTRITEGNMDPSAASGLAAFGLVGTLFLLVLAVLWICVPFAVFGIKPLLRDLIAEQRKTQELLSAIGRQIRDGDARLPEHRGPAA